MATLPAVPTTWFMGMVSLMSVRVVVDKPGALPHTESIAVEILRKRGE